MADAGLIQLAEGAVRSTGELLQSLSTQQRGVEKTELGGREFKLGADRRAHEHLASQLRSSDLPVLSEEDTSSHVVNLAEAWVIDPLDGSFNFMRSLGHSMVSCAYVVKGQPALGFLFDVLTGDVYVGGQDMPSTKNGEPIRCSTTSALMSAAVCTGFPARFDFTSAKATSEYLGFMSRFGKVRMFGSAAYSLCAVATGAADVYMERSIMFWDVAAAIAVAQGAGARLLTPIAGGAGPLSLVVAAESLQSALHDLVI
ncbi:MAG: inositol monophosphatase family protein [Ilumatobacteraceae bacterium]